MFSCSSFDSFNRSIPWIGFREMKSRDSLWMYLGSG